MIGSDGAWMQRAISAESSYGGAILSCPAAFCYYHAKQAYHRTFQSGSGIVPCQTSSDRGRAHVFSRNLKGKGGQAAHGTRQFKIDGESATQRATTNTRMNTPPDIPRRRLPFHLKWLIVIVVTSGAFTLWGTLRFRRAARQQAAVTQVRKLGGWAFYNCEFDESGALSKAGAPGPRWFQRLVGADFLGRVDIVILPGNDRLEGFPDLDVFLRRQVSVADAELAFLEALPDLKCLALSHTSVTDNGLKQYIVSLTKLERLWLDDTQVTDSGLLHIQGLGRLKRLSLKRTQISDAGLANLAAMTNLETLCLDGTNCTFSGVLTLLTKRHHRNLCEALEIAGYAKWSEKEGDVISLDLSITRLSDAELTYVKRLPGLEWLFLNGTQVTDAGLRHLAGLEHLTLIHLAKTGITDAGLGHLTCLPSLRNLHLEETRVTESGLRDFERATSGRVRVYPPR